MLRPNRWQGGRMLLFSDSFGLPWRVPAEAAVRPFPAQKMMRSACT